MRKLFSIDFNYGEGSFFSFTATEIPVICAPLYCPSVSYNDLQPFSDLKILNYFDNQKVDIDILIGLDFYWTFMKPGFVRAGNLVAQEILFGWVLSGTTSHAFQNITVSSSLLPLNSLDNSDMHRFGDLESIGILDNLKAPVDPVLTNFHKTVSFHDGRYEVNLLISSLCL